MFVECREVASKSELRSFIDFPHDLYQNDPNYVPEVYLGQKAIFNKKTYPFFRHGEVKLFLAYCEGKISGRIAAILNPAYNSFHQTNVGFFGFFDVIDDQNVVDILIQKAKEFALSKGCVSLIGPTNYTTNETAGLLVKGFNSPPFVMMTYNFPYYQTLLEKNGLAKEMDLLAYYIFTHKVNNKSVLIAEQIEKRLAQSGITVRQVNKKHLKSEAEKIKTVYNNAWENNWGFTPFSHEEFEHLRKDLTPVIDPEFAFIAEKNGLPVGFSITIPNVNEILIRNKRGRLWPWGLFRFLLGKRRIKTLRILALGVLPEYRQSGIEGLFYAKTIMAAKKRNKTGAEASWILENNKEMNVALQKLNGTVYKTYRLYSCKLIP